MILGTHRFTYRVVDLLADYVRAGYIEHPAIEGGELRGGWTIGDLAGELLPEGPSAIVVEVRV